MLKSLCSKVGSSCFSKKKRKKNFAGLCWMEIWDKHDVAFIEILAISSTQPLCSIHTSFTYFMHKEMWGSTAMHCGMIGHVVWKHALLTSPLTTCLSSTFDSFILPCPQSPFILIYLLISINQLTWINDECQLSLRLWYFGTILHDVLSYKVIQFSMTACRTLSICLE